jgi:putative alpha-1,2-mannosidase
MSMISLWQKQAARKSILSCVGTESTFRIDGGGRWDICRRVCISIVSKDKQEVKDTRLSIEEVRPDAQDKCRNLLSGVPPVARTRYQDRIFCRHLWSLSSCAVNIERGEIINGPTYKLLSGKYGVHDRDIRRGEIRRH